MKDGLHDETLQLSRPRNFPSFPVLSERIKYFCANFSYILCYVRFA